MLSLFISRASIGPAQLSAHALAVGSGHWARCRVCIWSPQPDDTITCACNLCCRVMCILHQRGARLSRVEECCSRGAGIAGRSAATRRSIRSRVSRTCLVATRRPRNSQVSPPSHILKMPTMAGRTRPIEKFAEATAKCAPEVRRDVPVRTEPEADLIEREQSTANALPRIIRTWAKTCVQRSLWCSRTATWYNTSQLPLRLQLLTTLKKAAGKKR